MFDFCGNCESSDAISKRHKNVLNIDCSNSDMVQGFGYNEIEPTDDSSFERYRCAKQKTSQLMTLVNTLAEDELKDRMERYMESASLIFSIQGGSTKDIFKVLKDYKLRSKYIPEGLDINMDLF